MTATESTRPALVFCSYAHRDRPLCEELKAHLSPLERRNLIDFFWDRTIKPGEPWDNRIAAELERADIILLLISVYFVESNYCFRREMARALARHQEQTAIVVPIYLRKGAYRDLPFAKLQGLPPDLVPITAAGPDHDNAWTEVAMGVDQAREEVVRRRQSRMERSHTPAEPDPAEILAGERETYLRHLIIDAERSIDDRPLTLEVRGAGSGRRLGADAALREWCDRTASRLLLLSGAPGSGKTTTIRTLAAGLARTRLLDERRQLPLLVRPQMLTSTLAELHESYGEGRAVISEIQRGAPSVLLVDGLDEASLAKPAVERLIDLLGSTPPATRIVAACRTHLAPEVEQALRRAEFPYEHLEVAPLEQAQVSSYFAGSGIDTTAPLLQQAREPVILKLARDACSEQDLQTAETLLDLYRGAIRGLLIRAIEQETALQHVRPWQLQEALAGIAGQMFPRTVAPMADLQFEIEGATCEELVSAFAAVGLLTLDTSENVSFAHASFYDYFFALLLHRTMAKWSARYLARTNLIFAYHVNRFLLPLLLERAGRIDGLLTRTISQREFAEFARATGWRQDTGFGRWMTFQGPDGTSASTDGSLPEDGMESVLHASGNAAESPAVQLSWYDAMQYAIWAGGRLPKLAELAGATTESATELEWTCDWHREEQAQIAVRPARGGQPLGFNPDFRASRIGFRIVVPSNEKRTVSWTTPATAS